MVKLSVFVWARTKSFGGSDDSGMRVTTQPRILGFGFLIGC